MEETEFTNRVWSDDVEGSPPTLSCWTRVETLSEVLATFAREDGDEVENFTFFKSSIERFGFHDGVASISSAPFEEEQTSDGDDESSASSS